MTEDKYEGLLNFTTSDKFSEREKVALTYTSAIVWNSEIADDLLWEKLHRHFTIEERVELGFFIGLTLGQQRWIKTLNIGHGQLLGDTTTGLAPALLSGCARQPRNRSRARRPTPTSFEKPRGDAFHSPRGFPTIPREEEFFSQNYQAIKGQ